VARRPEDASPFIYRNRFTSGPDIGLWLISLH
jgi:hypothetical protein